MGLDIHSVIEVATDNSQTWKIDTRKPFEKDDPQEGPLPGMINLGRMREMFWLISGKLGVRTDLKLNGLERGIWATKGLGQIPVPTRGLPPDMSKEVRAYWDWVKDDHNGTPDEAYPSWLSYKELYLMCELYKQKRTDGLWGFIQVVRRMGKIEREGGRARFVFWFSY